MGLSNRTSESWRVDGPTTLHEHDDDLVYMLIRADTDDPELGREVALVSAWDLEGERYAHMIAAVPKMLAACQAVVERWEHGDLAEAARMCAKAAEQATETASPADGHSSIANSPSERDGLIAQLLAKAAAAGLEIEDLDETVHELAASIAADVNNEGMEGQLGYMIDQLGVQGATKQLERLAEEQSVNTDNDVED